jgi:hypothetical protein
MIHGFFRKRSIASTAASNSKACFLAFSSHVLELGNGLKPCFGWLKVNADSIICISTYTV